MDPKNINEIFKQHLEVLLSFIDYVSHFIINYERILLIMLLYHKLCMEKINILLFSSVINKLFA